MKPKSPSVRVVSPTSSRLATGKLIDRAYEEFCLLQEAGESPRPESFVGRYPTIRSSLGRLLDAHQILFEKTKVNWPEIGDTYHGFRLEHHLGDGASSRVFLATEPALGNRKVALKITQQGEKEAFTLGRTHHANVIPIHARIPVPEQDLSIICMQYMGSATLCSLLDRVLASAKSPANASIILEAAQDPYADATHAESLSPRWKAKSYEAGIRALFADVCSALEYLHANNILHRDLKPSNILMRPDGSPVLLDFHLSRDDHGPAGSFGGTYPYMPPEQLRAMTGEPVEAMDERSDLFAVGVLLWETLTGKLPFGSMSKSVPTSQAVSELLARQEAGFQAKIPNGWTVSPDLVAIVRRCLAVDPAERPKSAAELRRLLAPVQKQRRIAHWTTAVAATAATVAGLWFAAAPSAARINPDVAKRYEIASGFYKLGDDRAREAFREITSDRPKNPRGWWALALASAQNGTGDASRLTEAYAASQKANKLDPTPNIYAFTGYLHQLQREMVQAKQQYDLAMRKIPISKAVLNNYASLLVDEGSARIENMDDALQYTTQILNDDPNCQPALINRARAEYKLATETTKRNLSNESKNDFRKGSLKDLQLALKIGPPSADLHYKIAAETTLLQPNESWLADVIWHLDEAIKLGADMKSFKRKLNNDTAWDLIRNEPAFQNLSLRPQVESPFAKWQLLVPPLTELPAWIE